MRIVLLLLTAGCAVDAQEHVAEAVVFGETRELACAEAADTDGAIYVRVPEGALVQVDQGRADDGRLTFGGPMQYDVDTDGRYFVSCSGRTSDTTYRFRWIAPAKASVD